MYVLQGGNSWTLVPDQASDSDVAALNPGGEIDGTLPNELFVVQAPAAPPPQLPLRPRPRRLHQRPPRLRPQQHRSPGLLISRARLGTKSPPPH